METAGVVGVVAVDGDDEVDEAGDEASAVEPELSWESFNGTSGTAANKSRVRKHFNCFSAKLNQNLEHK